MIILMIFVRLGGVVFEGAQGTMLDIDHGTFPYVTSSNTTLSGVVSGTGVNMGLINYGLGITKGLFYKSWTWSISIRIKQ